MRARLTTTQYSASVEVPFEIVVQIQNNEEIIKEIQARPGLLAREAFTAQPLVASLFPGETTEINLVITLPRTTTSGLYQLPIEIRDENGIIGNLMANIQIAPFDDVHLSVTPRVVNGGRKTSFVVTATNRGNRTTGVSVAASDSGRTLKYEIEPPKAQIIGGQALAFSVTAAGRRPFKGNPIPNAIQIEIASRTSTISETVTFNQKPIIGRGLITALILAVVIFSWAVIFTKGFQNALSGQASKKTVALSWPTKDARGNFVTGGQTFDTPTAFGSLSIRLVAESDSRPIPRMIVTATPLTNDGEPVIGSSGEDGFAVLAGLICGSYSLTVSGNGYNDLAIPEPFRVYPRDLPVQYPDEVKVVGKAASISGTIAGEDKQQINQIQVSLMKDNIAISSTDFASEAGGAYALTDLKSPGRYRLTFSAPGFEPTQLFQEVAAGETVLIPTVKVQAGLGVIIGIVTDVDGNLLGGASVTAKAGADAIETVTATTGKSLGTFTLSELRSPATYLIQVSLAGYGTQTLTTKVGPGAIAKISPAIVMSKGVGEIRGVITDLVTKKPIGEVAVTASNGAVVSKTISVSSDGQYFISGLPPAGSVTLTFSKDGYQTTVASVKPLESKTFDIALQPTSVSLTGKVKGSAALVGATITATSGPVSLSTMSTSPDGAFRLDGVTPGWWTITFAAKGFSDTTTLVQIGSAAKDLGTLTMEVAP